MGQRKLIFPPVPFSVEDIKLATLISDIRNPHQDPGPVLSTDPSTDWTVRTVLDVESSLGREKTSSFWAQVTRLLRLWLAKGEDENLVVKAKSSKIYELKNQRIFCEHQRRCYLIVGLRTFIDASLTRGDKSSEESALDIKIPVGEALKAQTGVDVGEALDVGAGAGKAKSTTRREEYRFEGEMVFAIAYRKVIIDKVSEDKTPDLHVGNVWRMYDDVRGERPYEDYLIDLEDTDLALLDESDVQHKDTTEGSDSDSDDEDIVAFAERFETANGEEYFVM
ncbi:hypothetical protein FSARC_13926 [Fusarium sarcochroum]|uniref:Uncharacterized protein n=1 Tax=Fusarium sarcochroum TaxID=1208366 RepID=A0A8H4SY32_9HYPO|nr:hypothetical protein FSARC_13926 [Fusarium sarcochroum]